MNDYLDSQLTEEEALECLMREREKLEQEEAETARIRREAARRACFKSYELMYGYED